MQDWASRLGGRLIRRQRLYRRRLLGDSDREGVLDQLGVIQRKAVLGLQDEDRAGVKVILRQVSDFMDQVCPDLSGTFSALSFCWTAGWPRYQF